MGGRKPLPTQVKQIKGTLQPCRTNYHELVPEGSASWTFIDSERYDTTNHVIKGADGAAIAKYKIILPELQYDQEQQQLQLIGILRGDIEGSAAPG
jgi:hypothetical protein